MPEKIPKMVLTRETGLKGLARKMERISFNAMSDDANNGGTVILIQKQTARKSFDRRLRIIIPNTLDDELHNRLFDGVFELSRQYAERNPWS